MRRGSKRCPEILEGRPANEDSDHQEKLRKELQVLFERELDDPAGYADAALERAKIMGKR